MGHPRFLGPTSSRSGLTAANPRSLRLRDDSNIRLGRLPASGILLLRFFVRNIAADDDVVARLPVHWRRNFVLGRELNGIDDAQDLVEVAAGAHGIAELQLDLLVGTDHEN